MNLNKSIDLILYNLGYISALIANECSYYFNNILIIEQNKELEFQGNAEIIFIRII